jgi:hypothetical protein
MTTLAREMFQDRFEEVGLEGQPRNPSAGSEHSEPLVNAVQEGHPKGMAELRDWCCRHVPRRRHQWRPLGRPTLRPPAQLD